MMLITGISGGHRREGWALADTYLIYLDHRSIKGIKSMVDRCRSHRPADRWLSLSGTLPPARCAARSSAILPWSRPWHSHQMVNYWHLQDLFFSVKKPRIVYLQGCNMFKFYHLASENELRKHQILTADVIPFPAGILADHVSICVGFWSVHLSPCM